MNVLFLTKSVVDYHGFIRNYELAKGLVRLGHKVTLIAAAKGWKGFREKRNGVEIVTFFDFSPYKIKKGGLSVIDVISRLIFLMRNDFDMVFVDSGFRPVTGVPGHLYSKLKKVPYVCEWWDWLGKGGLYERKSKKYQYTLGVVDNYFEIADKRKADGIVALSTRLRQRALELGKSDDEICIIYGGSDIDTGDFPSKKEARDKLGIPQNAKVVGFAGMDAQEIMDIRPFLEALPLLKQKHQEFKWFSTGGKIREDFVNKYNISDEYVEFGWVDYSKYKYCLACADVLLLVQENNLINQARWPNKLGDYMAAGRPVLATKVGEIEQFMNMYPENGIHLIEWDKNDVIKALDDLFTSETYSEQLGAANLCIAKNSFSWSKKAEQLNDFLLKIKRNFSTK